jgi:hypothetical protein
MVDEQTLVVANYKSMHAACWWLKRDDVQLIIDTGELTYGLRHPDQEPRLIPSIDKLNMEIEKRRAASAGGIEKGANVMVYTSRLNWVSMKDQLPEPRYFAENTFMSIAFF